MVYCILVLYNKNLTNSDIACTKHYIQTYIEIDDPSRTVITTVGGVQVIGRHKVAFLISLYQDLFLMFR
jgi:hypothetical protein